jgi:hypothetical protein
VSVLRAATLEGLRHAVKHGRIVVAADPRALARARARNRLAIDARLVARALIAAEPELFRDDP